MLTTTLIAIALAAQNGESMTCATVDPLLRTAVVVFPNRKARVSTYRKLRNGRIVWNRPTNYIAKEAALETGRAIKVDCKIPSAGFVSTDEITVYVEDAR